MTDLGRDWREFDLKMAYARGRRDTLVYVFLYVVALYIMSWAMGCSQRPLEDPGVEVPPAVFVPAADLAPTATPDQATACGLLGDACGTCCGLLVCDCGVCLEPQVSPCGGADEHCCGPANTCDSGLQCRRAAGDQLFYCVEASG